MNQQQTRTIYQPLVAPLVTLAIVMVSVAAFRSEARNIVDLRSELRASVDSLRSELRTGVGDLRSELHTSVDSLRSELRASVGDLRTNLRDLHDMLRAEFVE